MKFLNNIILSFMILSFTINTFGQEKLSLTNAVNKSLKHNYDIHIVKRNQKVSEINNAWGAAGRFPSIDFDLSSNNPLLILTLS